MHLIIVDLDIVNPYFITSNYSDDLMKKGIRIISPNYAGSNVDVPSLPAEINSVLEDDNGYIILDVGGEDDGAGVLGRYADKIDKIDYRMYYVINKFRRDISNPEDAVALMRNIERASHLKVTDIVNNSHLSELTTTENILNSIKYAEQISGITELPLTYTTIPKGMVNMLSDKINNAYPVDVIVKLPWADKNS